MLPKKSIVNYEQINLSILSICESGSDQDAVEPRGEGTHGGKEHTRGEGTHADDFLFLSSHVERAVDSCRAFQTGLFASDKLHADISIRDDLLRFFEFCPRYLIDVKHNKSSLTEYNTWRELILETVTKQIGEHLKVVTPFNMSVGNYKLTLCTHLFSFFLTQNGSGGPQEV